MSGKAKNRIRKGLWRAVTALACFSLLALLACSSGTSSSASSATVSGTGTGWTISVQLGTNPILQGNTTSVLAVVKDRTGAPAPNGTNICVTAVRNGFLKPGATDLFATICETTSNNLGQTIQTYAAVLYTGVDTIQVSSQGVIATANITVNANPALTTNTSN